MDDTRFTKAVDIQKEVGILAFNVGMYHLGINLNKVQEITRIQPLKEVPYSHILIMGVFELRHQLIPAINMARWLGTESKNKKSSRIIIVQLLGLKVGLVVDQIDQIHRLRWIDIEPSDRIQRFTKLIIGTIKRTDQLINLIDYESLILDIYPEAINVEKLQPKRSKKLVEKRKAKTIWIIEDSKIIQDFLIHHLKKKGYSNLIFFENGQHALETLSTLKSKKNRNKTPDGENDRVDLIITDIEMPLMNGYTLVKYIKEDPILKKIPTILFSSFISSENKLKGEIVDADAQLSKSESNCLLPLIDRLIFS